MERKQVWSAKGSGQRVVGSPAASGPSGKPGGLSPGAGSERVWSFVRRGQHSRFSLLAPFSCIRLSSKRYI